MLGCVVLMIVMVDIVLSRDCACAMSAMAICQERSWPICIAENVRRGTNLVSNSLLRAA